MKPWIGAGIIAVLAVVIATPFLLRHQSKSHREHDSQTTVKAGLVPRIKKALKKLQLTEDQKAKTKQLLTDTRKKLDASKKSGSEEASAPKRHAILDAMWVKMGTILTPDQEKKLEEKVHRKNETQFDAAPATAQAKAGG